MRRQVILRLGSIIHLPVEPRLLLVLLTLTGLLAVSTLHALLLGSTDLTITDLIRWLSPFQPADPDRSAIMLLRWPRISVAILAGAMTAGAGYLLQVAARNGLADPGLLGISQGSMAAVVIGGTVMGLSPVWLAWLGLAGGFATALFVMTLAYRLASPASLILVGLAVSIVLGAMIEIVMVSGGILQFARWLAWSHGSLTAVSASNAGMVMLWAAVLLPLSLMLSGRMMPLLLGHEQAAGIGASPQRLSLAVTMIAAAMVAPIVAAVGPIAFLGLIAGHIARKLVGERPASVLPVAMLCGALILLYADTAGRTLFLPIIVPAGILVSIAGVLTFLVVARLSRSRR